MALKVLVSMMSAPASRYSRWIVGDDVGLGQREQVVVALQVARPVGEALAAVARLGGPVALDHRAHGAVDAPGSARGGARSSASVASGRVSTVTAAPRSGRLDAPA